MTIFRNTPNTAKPHASADALLRDVAFVLRMTRKVKTDLMAEKATTATTEPQTFTRPEPGVCAV